MSTICRRKRAPEFRLRALLRPPHRRTSRLRHPIPILSTFRQSRRLRRAFREHTAPAPITLLNPGVNQKDNDDDRTNLRNTSATGGYAEKVSADRGVRRAGFPRADGQRIFLRGSAAVSAIVPCGHVLLVRHGH